MTRVQPNAQFVLLAGLGDDDGRPYAAQIDADGKVIVTGGAGGPVDATDVTYEPTTPTDWDVEPENAQEAFDDIAARVTVIEGEDIVNVYPHNCFKAGFFLKVVTGAAISLQINTSQAFNMQSYQSPGALGDVTQFTSVLAAGNYTISLICTTSSNRGIIKLSGKLLGAASFTDLVTGIDTYSSGDNYNVIKTGTFNLTVSGLYIFRLTVTGKHASSSGYYVVITALDIQYTTAET